MSTFEMTLQFIVKQLAILFDHVRFSRHIPVFLPVNFLAVNGTVNLTVINYSYLYIAIKFLKIEMHGFY